jgi:tripartite-type tricarboxylate transporter receptor subunit TctC
LIAVAAALAVLSGVALGAGAQTATQFPNKPITVVIPASPGGAIDLVARVAGQKVSESLKQPIVVDNKAGATGIVGTEFIFRSPPDGHSLVLAASSHAINPSMFKKLPYDTIKGFEPVILTHSVPLVLVVNAKLPVNNVKELIEYGKKNPGKLTFASSGNGGAPHMSGELFKSMTGIDMTHIPYKGSTAAHPDLISGQTSMMFDTVAAVMQHVKSGAVKALAVTTPKRASIAPDVPTMAEAGLPGYETSTWGGILAPAGTPKDVVAKLNAEWNKALSLPDVKERINGAGIEIAGGTPAQYAAFIQSEMTKWAKVAKDAKIEPE